MTKAIEVFLGDGSKSAQKKLAAVRESLAGIKLGYEAAVNRSLNRGARSGVSSAVKSIRQEYTAKAKTIRSHFSVEKSKMDTLEAVVSAKGKQLPLSAFRFRPKTDTTGNARKTVRVAVKNGGGLKPLGATFVWKGRLLHRDTSKSLPLRDLKGPSIPQMAGNRDVVADVEKTMLETFLKRLDHEVENIMAQGVKGKNGGKIHGRD